MVTSGFGLEAPQAVKGPPPTAGIREVRGYSVAGLCSFLPQAALGVDSWRQIAVRMIQIKNKIEARLFVWFSDHLGKLPRTKYSHPVSRLLRPVFEHVSVRRFVGTQLAALSMAVSALSVPSSALGVVWPWQTLAAENEIQIDVNTEESAVQPVPETVGISQGFHLLHPGLDIRAPLGSEIYPIKEGVVKQVSFSRFGYGRHVVVSHSDGDESLYAHMGKVFVEEGELVSAGTALGEIGLTGRTTGPHLHLEVIHKGRKANPVAYVR